MKTGHKKTFAGWHQKRQRPYGKKGYETIKEDEKLQSNKDVTVQCIDFCEATTSDVHAVMRHAPADLRGGTLLQHTRVLVATVAYQDNPHLCLQILHATRSQIFRGANILLRVLADTKSQEAQELLKEIRRQSSVSVLSGHAIVIACVATASVFLGQGKINRICESRRKNCEDNTKKNMRRNAPSMHTSVTYMTRWQFTTLFPPQIRDSKKMTFSLKTQQHRMTRKMKQNSPHPTHCKHGNKFRRSMRT